MESTTPDAPSTAAAPVPSPPEGDPPRPSYLGLLNSIAVAEHGGHAYLTAWSETTTNADLAAVLRFVAVREGEHHHAFRKRIVELGFDVRWPASSSKEDEDVAIARSVLPDPDKWRHFDVGRVRETDQFDGMFADKTLDPLTGALLGRFIAEERDSARRLASYGKILLAT